MRRCFFYVMTFAVLTAVVVGVDLFAFYALDIKPGGYAPERFFEFSPRYGHQHRPGVEGYWYRYLLGEKYKVKTNSHGFADDERTFEKSRPRIALIGDSTTEFWEVDEPGRGQYVLEEGLEGDFEVLNFGVRAYGTDQTLLLLTHEVIKFQPDIVIYSFCVNDVADNSSKKGKPYFELDPEEPDGLALRNFPVETPRSWKKYGKLYERSFVFRLFDEARNALMLGTRAKRLLGRYERPEPHFELRSYKRQYDEKDRARMDLTLALISRMSDFAKEKGIRLLVVEGIYKPMDDPKTYAQVVEIYGDVFDRDRLTNELSHHCRNRGIPFVSLAAAAREHGVDVTALTHSRDNMHLDDRGVRLFAEIVADALKDLGWTTL